MNSDFSYRPLQSNTVNAGVEAIQKRFMALTANAHRIGFLEGQIEGIRAYAIWRNGEQLVGCLEKPLEEVLAPLQKEIEELKQKNREMV